MCHYKQDFSLQLKRNLSHIITIIIKIVLFSFSPQMNALSSLTPGKGLEEDVCPGSSVSYTLICTKVTWEVTQRWILVRYV